MFVGRPTNIYHLSPVVEEAAGEEALAVVLRVHGCSEGGAHTLAGNVAQRGERREPHPMLGVDQRAGQRRDPGGVPLRGCGSPPQGQGPFLFLRKNCYILIKSVLLEKILLFYFSFSTSFFSFNL